MIYTHINESKFFVNSLFLALRSHRSQTHPKHTEKIEEKMKSSNFQENTVLGAHAN